MSHRRRRARKLQRDRAAVPTLRRNALATAIATILTPAAVHIDVWQRNIEIFVEPTSEHRNLSGGRWLEPLLQDNISLFYSDIRGVFDIGSTEELNFGLGYRHLIFDRRWILGGYASIDTRSTSRDNRFNQITLGVEALSREWDLHANGYLPLTDEKLIGSSSTGGIFQGQSLFSNGVFEEALHGADVEAGRLLEFIPFGETRLFVGSYWFDGNIVTESTGVGLRARLEFRPRKDIALEIGAQHDELFGTESFLRIRYSFGMPKETGVRTLDERMVQFA